MSEPTGLEGTEIAAARLMDAGRAPDPVYVRRVEAELFQALDDRRRYEQWRLGAELYCELYGFVRDGLRLELRGKLRREYPEHGCILNKEGVRRRWRGPGTPRLAVGSEK